MTCDDLRLGGTLSAAGITGGTSINSTALAVADWSGLLGHSGLALTPFEVAGRPGAQAIGDGLGRARLPILNTTITKWGPNGVGSLVEPTADQQLLANTDDFLTFLSQADGNYLEVDEPDSTSRFIHVRALDPAQIAQRVRRRVGVPLFAEWPYWWAGGTENSDTLAGANDIMVVGGEVNIYDAILVFSGDLVLTHNDLGWTLTIAGSGAAVTVDLGERTVTEGGSPAPGLLTRNNRDWGWFTPGSNDMTVSAGNVAVTWRDQWQ